MRFCCRRDPNDRSQNVAPDGSHSQAPANNILVKGSPSASVSAAEIPRKTPIKCIYTECFSPTFQYLTVFAFLSLLQQATRHQGDACTSQPASMLRHARSDSSLSMNPPPLHAPWFASHRSHSVMLPGRPPIAGCLSRDDACTVLESVDYAWRKMLGETQERSPKHKASTSSYVERFKMTRCEALWRQNALVETVSSSKRTKPGKTSRAAPQGT
jgi:hypothetical protein